MKGIPLTMYLYLKEWIFIFLLQSFCPCNYDDDGNVDAVVNDCDYANQNDDNAVSYSG